jgi:lactoylglutathione lyase
MRLTFIFIRELAANKIFLCNSNFIAKAPSKKVNTLKVKTVMFVHTSIRTSNMEQSITFYTKLLGLRLVSRREIPQNNAEIAFLRDTEARGATLELTCYRNQKKFSQADYEDRVFDHIAFEVKDIETTIAAMREANVTITDEPFRLAASGSLIAFVEDPDGTLIELIQKA